MGKQARIKQEKMEQVRCPVPDCGQLVSLDSKYGLCKECTRIVNTLLFALPRIKLQSQQAPSTPQSPLSKLIVPGQRPPPPMMSPRPVDPKQ